MELTQGSELLDEGEVGDADVDLLGDALVVREHGQHHRLGSLVENLKALVGRLREYSELRGLEGTLMVMPSWLGSVKLTLHQL